MIQDRVFVITFEGRQIFPNDPCPTPVTDYKSLNKEYDKTTARMLYWLFFLNMNTAFSRRNMRMNEVAHQLKLDAHYLARMYVI